jgi:hypothetical protein
MFHIFSTGRNRDSGFACGADVNVEKCARHHADPTCQHVRPELHTGQSIKVIAQIKWNQRTKPEQENELRAFFADCAVNALKLFVRPRDRFDLPSRDESSDKESKRGTVAMA